MQVPLQLSALGFFLGVAFVGVAEPARVQPPPLAGKTDIWVLAGQSNMQGYGIIGEKAPANPKVAVFELSNRWGPAVSPTHRIYAASAPVFKRIILELNPTMSEEAWAKTVEGDRIAPIGGVGPDLSFADTIVQATGRNVALVPCALGGTTMEHWNPAGRDQGGESLYGNLLERIRRVGGNIKGMLWYQGEGQTGQDATVARFESDFLQFVDAIRRDTGQPDLPFIYVQIARVCAENHDGEARWQAVQEMQRTAVRKRKGLWMVPAVDLPMDDLIHIGADGQRRLGRRLAQVALTQVYHLPGHGTPIDFASCEVMPGAQPLHHGLRVKFTGVSGKLQALGRPSGFELSSEDGKRDGPMVYRVEFDPADPAAVILWCSKAIKSPVKLRYALGMDRYANITDSLDMAVPAFGPVEVRPSPTAAALVP